MHALEKLRDMLMEELEKCSEKDSLSTNSLYTVDKLTHAVKSIDTIMAMEEGGYSSENAYARGRRRDSMGRYARRSNDNAYEGGAYRGSYRRGGNSNRGYARDDMGYSREEKEELVEQLRDISMGAQGEHKQMIDEWIRQLEMR